MRKRNLDGREGLWQVHYAHRVMRGNTALAEASSQTPTREGGGKRDWPLDLDGGGHDTDQSEYSEGGKAVAEHG